MFQQRLGAHEARCQDVGPPGRRQQKAECATLRDRSDALDARSPGDGASSPSVAAGPGLFGMRIC
jgi:hypothetical protein